MTPKNSQPSSQPSENKITCEQKYRLTAPYMQNRELSWLTFDERVLDQGADPNVALLERLNFISIFWSNLQEFFMVRVGSLTDLSYLKKPIIDSKSGLTPTEQIDAIHERCRQLYPYQQTVFENLRAELAARGVRHLHINELTTEQKDFLKKYAMANIAPFLSPQIINSRHPFPHLENGALYVVVRLDETVSKGSKGLNVANAAKSGDGASSKKKKKKKKGAQVVGGAEGVTLGIIPMPKQCSRVIKLPSAGAGGAGTGSANVNGAGAGSASAGVQGAGAFATSATSETQETFDYILLEEVLEDRAKTVFDMYEVKHTNIICVTRNADLDTEEGSDETDVDYREFMKRILKKRGRLAPVRLESNKPLSKVVEQTLLEQLNLSKDQTYVTSVPLDLSYTWGLSGKLTQKQRAGLVNPAFNPAWPARIKPDKNMTKQVLKQGTMLLNYPYESMDPFVKLLEEAAVDPAVVSIRITLYRLASVSRLAEALIRAAENGKEVTALFELRARFDENNNIHWSQQFEESGCNVIYGFHYYKVHSKICSITRQTENGLQFITQLGTGNYNEKTARLYTDLSYITTSNEIGMDAVEFFRNMQLENAADTYKTLWVAPLQIKQNIISGIDAEIEKARAGKPCGLFFKTNSVTDKEVMDKLVEASQAGVPTTLFVRGISCIVPHVKGYTENIRVVSIVGRLLEHSRIYIFGDAGLNDIVGACVEDGTARAAEGGAGALNGEVGAGAGADKGTGYASTNEATRAKVDTSNIRLYCSSADLMTRNMDKRVEIAWPITEEAHVNRILDYLYSCLSDTAKLRELNENGTYTAIGAFAKNPDGPLFESQLFNINLAKMNKSEQEEARAMLRGADTCAQDAEGAPQSTQEAKQSPDAKCASDSVTSAPSAEHTKTKSTVEALGTMDVKAINRSIKKNAYVASSLLKAFAKYATGKGDKK